MIKIIWEAVWAVAVLFARWEENILSRVKMELTNVMKCTIVFQSKTLANPDVKKTQTQLSKVHIMADKWLITTQIFHAHALSIFRLPQETVVIFIIFCSMGSKGAACNLPSEQREQLKHTCIDSVSKTSNCIQNFHWMIQIAIKSSFIAIPWRSLTSWTIVFFLKMCVV